MKPQKKKQPAKSKSKPAPVDEKEENPAHTPDHLCESAPCALCRIKMFEKIASENKPEAIYAILNIAQNASQALERIRIAANEAASSEFSTNDFNIGLSLANDLIRQSRPIDTWLASQLPEQTKIMLSNYEQLSDVPPIEAALLQFLNSVRNGPSIYESRRFASVDLRPETKSLLSQALQTKDITRLNRLLIEDAYPGALIKKYEEINKLIRKSTDWPILTKFPEEKRPWLKDLGTGKIGLPFSWRQIRFRTTPARLIIMSGCNIIMALRDLSARRMMEEHAKIARPLSEFPQRRFSQHLEDPVFFASFSHLLTTARYRTNYPETQRAPEGVEDQVRFCLSMMAELLELKLSDAETVSFIDKFLPKAEALSPANDGKIREWFGVVMEMLNELTHEDLAGNNLLKTMAPNDRGRRKENRKGEVNESKGEIGTRIFELLDSAVTNLEESKIFQTKLA